MGFRVLDKAVMLNWSPSTNLSQCWLVVETIRDRKCYEKFRVKVNEMDFFKLSEREACVAICYAALECTA